MPRRVWIVLALLLLGPQAPRAEEAAPLDVTDTPIAAGLVRKDAYTLTAPKNFLFGYSASVDGHLVNAVVEIPAGYVDKWEVKNDDGWMHWDFKDGKPRRVKYLGYPCNYGMVPRTVLSKERGGDGDPLDMLVLGAAVPRGSVLPVRVIGLLEMTDGGENDVKLVAVREGTAFAGVKNMEELSVQFPGVQEILLAWFNHYKEPGKVKATGFSDVNRALAVLNDASADFEKAHPGE